MDKEITPKQLPSIEILRKNRQITNNNIVLEQLLAGKLGKQRDNKNHNPESLRRCLEYLDVTEEELFEKCKNDIVVAKLVALLISINASRQGSLDEKQVLETCNEGTSQVGVFIEKLTQEAYTPTKFGKVISKEEKNKYSKHDLLKSFDGKISGAINGWVFAKMVSKTGGHQDNVFTETSTFCQWVIDHGEKTMLYVVIFDTDQEPRLQTLQSNFASDNLLIGNHFEIQQKIIDRFK